MFWLTYDTQGLPGNIYSSFHSLFHLSYRSLPIFLRHCLIRYYNLSFLDYLHPFCFLLIKLHCTFFISYKILPYHVYYYCIWLGYDRPSGCLLFHACFASFHTHASLPTFFVCFFVLFRSCCSHARVFGKTLVHEFPCPIAILNVKIKTIDDINIYLKHSLKLPVSKIYHDQWVFWK